nr:hypothetical protein [Tanacetum cinerariifolium]
RATIAKSFTLPRDSAPKVTSPAAEEGIMQQTINELTAFCTNLQRQHSELLAKFQAQEVEIIRLKERVKVLEDKDGVIGDKSGDDIPIKGRSNNEGEAPAERISNDSEEIARVLTSMDAATVLAGEANVPNGSGFIPTAGPPATIVSTGSESSALPPVADEPASPVRDVSKGEACPTDSDFIADQDRATIAKSSTLPYDTAPLDNQGVIGARSANDAPINGRRLYEEEGITGRVSSDTEEIRMDEKEVAFKRTSEDIEEMATVLTSMDAATVLAGELIFPLVVVSFPLLVPLLLTFILAVMLFLQLVRLLPLLLLLPLIQEKREKKLWWSLT